MDFNIDHFRKMLGLKKAATNNILGQVFQLMLIIVAVIVVLIFIVKSMK